MGFCPHVPDDHHFHGWVGEVSPRGDALEESEPVVGGYKPDATYFGTIDYAFADIFVPLDPCCERVLFVVPFCGFFRSGNGSRGFGFYVGDGLGEHVGVCGFGEW